MAPNQHGHHHDHYDSQTYAGDRATQVQQTQRHMPDEDRSTRSEIQANIAGSQSKQLASQVRIGDDRAIGDTPNWESMSSTELHAAATQSNNPGSSDSLGRAFNDGGNRLADAANRLMAAVGKLDAAWSGNAADSAKGALNPLADAAGQAGLAAQLMGAQMARQTAAASEVRKIPPPEEFDYQTELTTALANPNPVAGMADMKAKKDKADAVKREQVAYLNAYTQSMSAVDSQMPSFVEQPGHISGGDGSRSHITGGSVNYTGPVGGGVDRSGNQSTSPAPRGPWSGSSPGMLPGAGGEGTDGQDVGPLPNIPGGIGTGSSGYTPTPSTVPNLPGNPPGGGLHPSTPGAGSGGFGAGFGSFGPGGGGAAGGGGASGPGQAGRGPGGSGGPGRGPGAGGGPGGLGEHAGGAGRAGGAGAGRGGAGMGGGGAGGRKEEDDEHERPSYLVEADPDATFGTDEVTAPPVIGQE